jgi:Papain-like cysteine protease AvrRpt2
MTPASSPILAEIPPKFSGLEELDLTVPAPAATAHLRYGESSNAVFDAQNKCWCIQPGGSIQIGLSLPVLQGVTVILQPNMGPVTGIPTYPLTIKVNDHSFSVDFDPHSDPRTMVQSWYLPAAMFTTDNLITLTLSGSDPLYLQAVYVMVFDMQQQLESEWCWAAVTASLSNFLAAASPMTQCQVANKFLKQTGPATDCCQNPGAPACNQANSLSNALQAAGWLQCYHPFHLPPDIIRNLINTGKPLPILINWRDSNGEFGGGHFIVITGVGPDDPKGHGETMIAVEDPLNGPSFLPYKVLAKTYKGDGFWMYSYVLK